MKNFFLLSMLFLSVSAKSQTIGQCGQAYNNNENESLTYVQNIPSGITTQIDGSNIEYHYYANHYGVADQIKIYFDNVPAHVIWVGGFDCTSAGDGLSQQTCRNGPVYWTNESGSGQLSNISTWNIPIHFANSSSIGASNIFSSSGLVHLKIVPPPHTCQIKVETTPNLSEDSNFAADLQCPNLGCPQNAPVVLQSPAVCGQSNLTLDLQCSGTVNNSVLWTLPNGNTQQDNSLQAQQNGSYHFQINYSDSCVVQGDYILNDLDDALNVNTNVTAASCSGINNGTAVANATGGLPPYQFSWSNQSQSSTITGLSPGNYVLTVTDDSGCTSQQMIEVPVEEVFQINFDTHAVTCFGSNDGQISTQIAGSYLEPLNYGWQSTSEPLLNQESTIQNLPPGTYTVEVVDANGCSVVQSTDITSPSAPLSISADETAALCENSPTGTVQLFPEGGTPPYRGSIGAQSSISSMNFSDLFSGNHTAVVQDANGCTASLPIVVPYAEPTLKAVLRMDGCKAKTTISIQYPNGTTVHEDELVGKYFYKQVGESISYAYKGCEYSTTLEFEGAPPFDKDRVHIPNAFSPNGNQLNETFKVVSEYAVSIKRFTIANRWGEIILNQEDLLSNDPAHGWDGTYRGKIVPAEVYVYSADFECGEIITGSVQVIK